MRLKTSLTFLFIFSASLLFSQTTGTKFVAVSNTKMAYKTFGLSNRKAGEPVVVFESGMGSGGGNFEPTLAYLPAAMAGIIYDRNGLGESGPDSSLGDDAAVVKRLHDLLSTLKINPPYLLVGHSIGGPFIRLFAAHYPDDVCGLLFIDPTDFMLTQEEDQQVKLTTASKTGYRDIWKITLTQMAGDTAMPVGFRQEVKRELAASTPSFFREYTTLASLKNIPVTVIIAYNKRIEYYETEMNTRLKLGINMIPWWKEFDKLRIAHYAAMIKNNNQSHLIILPGYSHGIHHQDPKLVADAIVEIYDKCVKAVKKP